MSKRFMAVVGFILCSIGIFAQRQDFQTWTSVSVKGEIFNALDFDVTPELRLGNNSSQVKTFLTDIELSYPVVKYVRIGTQYRFLIDNNLSGNETRVNRYSLFGRVDYDISLLRLSYRAVYEWEFEGYNTTEYGKIPIQEMRHKISAGYYKKIWALRPEISCEFFVPVKPEFLELNPKIRASAGLTYRFSKQLSLSVDYKYQREFRTSNPATIHILAGNLSFSF
jgi:hypothetical protein